MAPHRQLSSAQERKLERDMRATDTKGKPLYTYAELCRTYGISGATLNRYATQFEIHRRGKAPSR